MPALTDTADRVAAALDELRATPLVASRLAHEAILPPSPARFEDWPEGLHPELRAALAARGLARAYCHQAEAVATALAGRDVTVVTPTASGKSLCFVVPVLDAWLRDRTSRSLWLFPTKALAQDQLAALQELSASLPEAPRAAPYDGDTPPGIRRAARQDGHIVVTNPDMLHAGILPHHTSWVRLFQNLRYIVIDELHAYRGLLGSHLANVLRRLFRLCRFYGSNPVVIACSATIANPRGLSERLLERPVVCVDRNGAPRAARRIWFWNPPLQGGVSRRSAVLEARRLVAELLRRELQTIAFARSRAAVELLLSHLRRLLPDAREGQARVRGYRGGYLPLERRAIEAGLRDGTLRGVVSTNALELGIDIGHLDAAVLVGYPGSIAGSWQQLGRAGRRDTESLGVLIATDSPLDQFLVRHPEYLLQSPPEQGLINPDNLLVLGAHLQAAAFELAFAHGESFGEAGADRTAGLLEAFREDGLVHRSGSRYHWSADAFPAEAISLRRASATNVVIIDTSTGPGGPGQGPQGPWSGSGGGRPGAEGRVVGEVDQFSAPVLVHDDAIYMHDGAQFHVERLDWEEKRAYVHPVSVDHHTLAETRQRLQVLDRHRGPLGAGWQRSLGEVRLSRLATMYKKVRLLTGENVGAGPISLPEQDLHTTACWLALDPAAAGFPSALERDAGLVAMARLLHSAACLLCMCDPRDLGTHVEPRGQALPGPGVEPPPPLGPAPVPEPLEQTAGRPRAAGGSALPPEVGRPTVYLYDAVAGGVGFAERCHEDHGELVALARSILEGCGCASGCPSCIGPAAGESDGRLAARALLSLAADG